MGRLNFSNCLKIGRGIYPVNKINPTYSQISTIGTPVKDPGQSTYIKKTESIEKINVMLFVRYI